MHFCFVQTSTPQSIHATVSILDFFQYVIASIVVQAGPKVVSDVKGMHKYHRMSEFCEQEARN